MSVFIDKDQCMGCGNCLSYCPKHLLSLSQEVNKRNVHFVMINHHEECVECGNCELMCTAAALHIEGKDNGYALLDKEHIPPHSGCYLGSLTKALADVIHEMHLEDKVVLFKKKASDVNMHVESHDYTDDNFYEDGLNYKKEHSDKVVIIISSSSKILSTGKNEERYKNLNDEKVTIINTLNYFESDPEITKLTCGGSHILEELSENSGASFIARSSVRSIHEIQKLKKYLKIAITNQLENKPFSIVEMTFPCFYRLAGRPQILMSSDKIQYINKWFDQNVKPDYQEKIYKEG